MRSKRKSESHIIEKKSLKIIEDILPYYWTIREYKPDYGLDLSIELFEEKLNGNDRFYDTLGEHLFVQVKGVKKVDYKKLKIKERNNIEDSPLKETDDYSEIEVIKFSIDTVELRTIQRMGNAVPVLLFLVDTEAERIFFVCLNDYIDKLLLPTSPDYYLQGHKTINVPVSNEITKEIKTILPLYLYAKRPKYYAFFNKVGYQLGELNYTDDSQLKHKSQHFAKILLHFDIWNKNFNWHALEYFHENLDNIISKSIPIIELNKGVKLDDTDKSWETNFSGIDEFYTEKETYEFMRIRSFWQQMDNLKNIYESMSREWFLPTFLNEVIK